MAENIIKIELCEEDRARLDLITQTLNRLIAEGLSCYLDPSKQPEPIGASPIEGHPVQDPFPGEPEQPEQITPPEAPAFNLADVQQKVIQLSAAGLKAQVRAIVKSYAEKVSAIPEDKFEEVMALLTGLEG